MLDVADANVLGPDVHAGLVIGEVEDTDGPLKLVDPRRGQGRFGSYRP